MFESVERELRRFWHHVSTVYKPRAREILASSVAVCALFAARIGPALRRSRQRVLAFYEPHRKEILVASVTVCAFCIGLLWAAVATLPGRNELRSLGDMSQATTLYDINN